MLEDTVENAASRVFVWTASHSQVTVRRKKSDDLLFRIVEAAWVVENSELLPDPNTKALLNKRLELFFRQPLRKLLVDIFELWIEF